jgi:hypothetical protein
MVGIQPIFPAGVLTKVLRELAPGGFTWVESTLWYHGYSGECAQGVFDPSKTNFDEIERCLN